MANLNLFVAYLLLATPFVGAAGMILMIFIGPLMSAPPSAVPSLSTSYFVLIAALLIIWFKKGFSPTEVEPAYMRRFRVGHGLIFTMNILVIGFVGAVLFLSKAKGADYSVLLWFAIPLLLAGYVVWLIGIVMIMSAKRLKSGGNAA